MTPEEAIDVALNLLRVSADDEYHHDSLSRIKFGDAWNTLEALRTEQAQARLVAQDPANQGQDALRDALDELEGAMETCAMAQKEGPLCYNPEKEHLDAIQAARERIVALFDRRQA